MENETGEENRGKKLNKEVKKDGKEKKKGENVKGRKIKWQRGR
jgi:hypothetical protein